MIKFVREEGGVFAEKAKVLGVSGPPENALLGRFYCIDGVSVGGCCIDTADGISRDAEVPAKEIFSSKRRVWGRRCHGNIDRGDWMPISTSELASIVKDIRSNAEEKQVRCHCGNIACRGFAYVVPKNPWEFFIEDLADGTREYWTRFCREAEDVFFNIFDIPIPDDIFDEESWDEYWEVFYNPPD